MVTIKVWMGVSSALAAVLGWYVWKECKLRKKRPSAFTAVLTGGPCAGKTSVLLPLKQALEKLNINCYTVPEAATTILSNGGVFPGLDAEHSVLLGFETALINLQLALESTFLSLSNVSKTPSVVIIDRGIADVKAYVPLSLWAELLNLIQQTDSSIHDRYDIVCHLVSAADGAPQFYNNSNNSCRSENIDEAIEMDRRCLQCWHRHPNLHIIDNSTDFDGKISRVVDLVLSKAKDHFRIA